MRKKEITLKREEVVDIIGELAVLDYMYKRQLEEEKEFYKSLQSDENESSCKEEFIADCKKHIELINENINRCNAYSDLLSSKLK